MRSTIPEIHRGMSNQFNTAANGGIGPLSTIHVRSRLIVDLLFADQICIPGTSLLCNPATLKMLAEEAAFFEGLLTDRKVVAILENDTASFADLADKLVAINSAALTTIGLPVSAARRAAREAANYMDQALSASQILRVKEDDLALIR